VAVLAATLVVWLTPAPPAQAQTCDASTTISDNFNSTALQAGHTIWFVGQIQWKSPGTGPLTVFLDSALVQFTANGTPYALNIPQAKIIYSPVATSTTTLFDDATQTWVTTVSPGNFGKRIFVSGLAFPVPVGGLPGSINPVSWSGRFTTDTPGVTVNWRWAAAAYSSFSTNYNALSVKATDGSTENPYPNTDQAGTPETYKSFVVDGARGGGGTNYTGSWTGGVDTKPCAAAAIGDLVWLDANGNGLQDGGEAGVTGVPVRLYDGNNSLVAATTTGANGLYSFTVPPGNYYVEYTAPAGWTFTFQNAGAAAADSDVDPSTGRTASFAAAGADGTRDAGLVRPGAIGDFVWYDADGDGIQDVGEPGIANVKLELRRAGQPIASTTTGADGGYLFARLTPGSYAVAVAQTNPALASLTHLTGNQSQPTPSVTIDLGAGEVYKDADFGYMREPGAGNAIIGDLVFYDGSGDGRQQPGEPGIAGISVCAAPQLGGTTLCATTDGNGRYRLVVPAGAYVVSATNPPVGYVQTSPPAYGVVLAEGDQYLDADFGFDSDSALGSIGNLVFFDADGSGAFAGGDSALPGAAVDLIQDLNFNNRWDDGELIVATTTSDAALDGNGGNYQFAGVPAGAYLVHVSDTSAVLTDFVKAPLGTANANNHNQADPYPVTLGAGVTANLADFGYTPVARADTGVIGNQVWIETDGDGVQTPANGDMGQPGVTVELYKNGEYFGKTTTGAGGDYAFTGLANGTYSVTVSDDYRVLVGLVPTMPGPNGSQDNHNKVQPYVVNLAAAGYHMAADFGYIRGGALGDYVWYDSDGDGLQDAFEPGIANVTLDLYRNNVKVASTATGADGGYVFKGLVPGFYVVDVSDANGVLAGRTLSNGSQSKPDPLPAVSLALGQVHRDADFGYSLAPGSGNAVIGDLVWYDYDNDGVPEPGEPGIAGVTVCATPSAGGTPLCDATDRAGVYRVIVPAGTYDVVPNDPPIGYSATTPAPLTGVTVAAGDQYLGADFGYDSADLATLGGTVWQDDDLSGALGAAEPRVPGVSVDLVADGNGNGVQDGADGVVATTTTDQNGDYRFSGLPAGSFLVLVSDTQNALDDFAASAVGPNSGQDGNNQAQPYAVTLAAGANNTTADFGYVRVDHSGSSGVIGSQIWYDYDGDGRYSSDKGDVGLAGVSVSLRRNNVPYDTTTTGAGGDYVFTSLPPGNYIVQVSDQYGILASHMRTANGPNPGTDNNSQAQPYSVILPPAQVNAAADFGYTRPGAIGDFVWYDVNRDGIENVGEPGIANVVLDLYRDNVKVASTATGADGGYLFANLPPGNYMIDVPASNPALAGLTLVDVNQGQPTPSMLVGLVAGDVFKDVDFAYVRVPAAGLAVIGDLVWYDVNADGRPQPGEAGVNNAAVCATPFAGGAPICGTTDASGVYRLEAPAGTYTVTAGALAGYALTTVGSYTVTVPADDQALGLDFGYDSNSLLLAVGNLVFADFNKNEVFDAGDAPLAGVSVDLIADSNSNGLWDLGEPIVATAASGSALDGAFGTNGNYLFPGVPAGRYLVRVSDTAAVLTDYLNSFTSASTADNRTKSDPYPILLTSAGNVTADFGYYRTGRLDTAVIGNQVWVETDGNGIFDTAASEAGQPGVAVELYRNGEWYAKTTTGASGRYAFVGLPPGSYAVQVVDDYSVVAAYGPTVAGANQGADLHNKVQPYVFSVATGGYQFLADFGYKELASIGDTIFYDDDHSGAQNGAEAGIEGIVVDLYTNGTGVCDLLAATRTTDRNGRYLFTGLTAGHYCVDVAANNPLLSGLQLTTGSAPHGTELAAFQPYWLADFGYGGTGVVRGIAFLDLDNNGTQNLNEPGLGGVEVCLFVDADKNGAPDSSTPVGCTATGTTGAYSFGSQLPGTYVLTETAPIGYTGTTSDTIKVTLVVAQGAGLADNNNFGEASTADYTLTKQLLTPDPIRSGEVAAFRMRITNVGGATLTFLPLRDVFNGTYLSYQSAQPAPNVVGAGQLDWTDLTATFGRDLAPNDSFTLTVNFLGRADTTLLPGSKTVNTASVTGARADPDGTGPLGEILAAADRSAQAAVGILNPTAVTLIDVNATTRGEWVALHWTTVDEAQIVGFNVLRSVAGQFTKENDTQIAAQKAGASSGATYEFVVPATPAAEIFRIEVVLGDGRVESIDVPVMPGQQQLFLPSIQR
jgi:protocatechuate 3,4-dioxygenase beta subunit